LLNGVSLDFGWSRGNHAHTQIPGAYRLSATALKAITNGFSSLPFMVPRTL
jgi:hypothetical protein